MIAPLGFNAIIDSRLHIALVYPAELEEVERVCQAPEASTDHCVLIATEAGVILLGSPTRMPQSWRSSSSCWKLSNISPESPTITGRAVPKEGRSVSYPPQVVLDSLLRPYLRGIQSITKLFEAGILVDE